MALRALFLAVLLSAVSGCQTARFYSQAVAGQWEILAKRQPIERLLAAPDTPADLRQQLQLVRELCSFATRELGLPAGSQYTYYADLERPFVVWNIHATPPFSLEAKSWWYPFVGRLEYQGYFRRQLAVDYARRLREEGLDVFAGGVTAYSTLGWFNDPVLNTFVELPESELADLIFHELAHRRLFVPGDTDFNEAFATAVAREGVRRWYLAKGDAPALERYLAGRRGEDGVVAMVLAARDELERLYVAEPPPATDEIRQRKLEIIEALRTRYRSFQEAHPTYHDYDAWMAGPVNNAQINTIDTYYQLLPGFEARLQELAADLPAFYEDMTTFRRLPKSVRRERLAAAALAAASKAGVLPDEPDRGRVQQGGDREHQPEDPLATLVTKQELADPAAAPAAD